MSENTFNPQELNLQLQPLPTYIDLDGSFRLNTPMLSSFDFNGLIPKFDGLISVSSVKPGYLIQVASGQYFPVVSVEYDEDDLEDVPSGIVTINYIDDQGNTSPIDYNQTSSVYVIYENWNEKILGTNGWGITSGGNAIFSNVAVRGNIEATSGKVEDLIIGQDYYPIGTIHGVENPSSSVTGDPGQIIMYVDRSDISPSNSRIKKLYKNDIVELSGVSASGWVRGFGYVEPASAFFEVFSRIKVLSASYNHPIGPSYFGDKYHCQIVQDSSIIYDWNLGSLSASSGSFTFGPMNMGSFWAFSETSSDVIEGFVFNQIGEGNNWDNYIPDYLDVSGRFRLGGGKLIFDGTTLSIDANVAVGNLSASYTSYDFLSASYANLNKLATSGQTIINGGNITTGTISANRIETGVFVTGTQLSTSGQTIINGGNITTGTISANRIETGVFVTGTQLSTSGQTIINGGNITTGTITGRTISGGEINGAVITGGTLQTNTVGPRVVINSTASSNSLLFYSGIAPEYSPGFIKVNKTGDSTFGYRGQVSISPPISNSLDSDTRIILLSEFDGTGSIAAGNGELILIRCPTIEIEGNTSIYGTTFLDNISSTGGNWTTTGQIKGNTIVGPNNVELRQILVDTAQPTSPGSYVNNTLWIVV